MVLFPLEKCRWERVAIWRREHNVWQLTSKGWYQTRYPTM